MCAFLGAITNSLVDLRPSFQPRSTATHNVRNCWPDKVDAQALHGISAMRTVD